MKELEDIVSFFFSQASELARILNPWIWLANHTLVTSSAFYDTAHRLHSLPTAAIAAPKLHS